jgi:hypothetical protein
MKCLLCDHPLKGMADTKRHGKLICCLDLGACRQRQEDNERAARGLPPRQRDRVPVVLDPEES